MCNDVFVYVFFVGGGLQQRGWVLESYFPAKPAMFCACPKPGPEFHSVYAVVIVCKDLR